MWQKALCGYPGGESNPDLEFRKLLFYPLNYQGIALRRFGVQS